MNRAAIALLATVLASPACVTRTGNGAPLEGRCPPGSVDNYLDMRWQQCWFEAAHGRWRTLSHDFHYDVLVVEVEAASLDDAPEIVRRFAGVHAGRFTDMTIYVHQEPASKPGRVRRVHWSFATDALDTLDFAGARGQ